MTTPTLTAISRRVIDLPERSAAELAQPPVSRLPATQAAAVPESKEPNRPTTPPPAPLQPPGETPPADKKPPARKRRYNAFRDRQARVKDFRKMLPRKVPRRRDIDIYQTVVHDKLSQHLVAEIYGLSPARISQIVREVRAWKATIPFEIPGMTERQQINLATHETIVWLARIRDKCMELADMTTGHETRSYLEEGRGTTHRTMSERCIPPKPGFLATALAAVQQIGKLAGAGEQWLRSRRPAAEGEEEFNVPSSTFKVDEGEQPPEDSRSGLQSASDEPALQASAPQHGGSGEEQPKQTLRPALLNQQPAPLNLEPGTLTSRKGRFSNKKAPNFSPQNGKCNGRKTSAFPRQAQVERLRRKKNRKTAYQAFAQREGVRSDSQPHFFRLLRELDRIVDRVEERVEQELRKDRSSSTPRKHPPSLQREREHFLEKFLQFQAGILTPPYDFGWVFEHYNAETGRFRWWEADGIADGG